MIDWLYISYPLTPFELDRLRGVGVLNFWGHKIFRIDPTGEIVSEKRIPEQIRSDSGSVWVDVGCGPTASDISINGNLTKILNRQNVFSSHGPDELLRDFLPLLNLFLGLTGDEGTPTEGLKMPPLFLINLHRIDITQSVWLPTEDDVLDFLNVMGYCAKRRKSKNSCDGTTIYFGKHSGEWATKMYSKYHELKSNPQYGIETESVQGLLRVEHVLRKHIKRNLWTFRHFCDTEFRDKLFVDMLDKITIPEAQMETRLTHIDLPEKLRPMWREWVSGTNLKATSSFWGSRATAYNWRSKLLKHGIDIFGPVNLDGAIHKENCISFALAQLRNRNAWAQSSTRKAA